MARILVRRIKRYDIVSSSSLKDQIMKNCPICISANFFTFYQSEFGLFPNRYLNTQHLKSGGAFYNFRLGFCESCRTVVNINESSDSEMFFDYVYRTPENLESLESIPKLKEFLVRELCLNKIQILEVGGNSGFYLRNLIASLDADGLRCDAVLLDKVEPASMNSSDSCIWINDFLTDNAVDNYQLESKFDLVIARHCMAHNLDALKLFRNLIEVTSHRGLLYIELTDLDEIFKSSNFGQFYPEHRYSFSKTSIETLCRVCGVQLVGSIDLQIHGGSAGYLIRPLPAGSGVRSGGPSDQPLNSLTASVVRQKHEAWLRRGEELVSRYREFSDLVLWGCSAKAVYSLNQFALGSVDFFEAVWDSTVEKASLFPPGFTTHVTSEPYFKPASKNIVLGAPNFAVLTQRIADYGLNIVGEFDRPH